MKYDCSPLTVPTDTPRSPTISPHSCTDESPKVIAMDVRTGLSWSSESLNTTDANIIPSNSKESLCSCLGVVGMSLVKFTWVCRVVVGLGGHSRKVGRQ